MTTRIEAIVDSIRTQLETISSHLPQAQSLVEEGEFDEAEESLGHLKLCVASLEAAVSSHRISSVPALELTEIQRFLTTAANTLPQVIQDVSGHHGTFSNQVDALHRKLWVSRLIDAGSQEEAFGAATAQLQSSLSEARANIEELEAGLELRDRVAEAAQKAEDQNAAAAKSASEAESFNGKAQELQEGTEALHESASELSAGIEELHKSAKESDASITSLEEDLREWHGDIDETRQGIESLRDSTKTALDKYDEDIKERQAFLEEVKERIEDQFRLVSSGALARAFGMRQKELFWTKTVLGFVALLAYVGFVTVAVWQVSEILKADAETFNWGPLTTRAIAAIPMGLLIWFVTVQYGKARRTHESYSFKETVAASFDAYRDLVEKITKDEKLKDNAAYADFIRSTIAGLYQEPPLGKEEDDHPPSAKALKDSSHLIKEIGVL
ncbi:MAG: hypothetical protein ISQ11_16555, partial [Planctomycetes bacterium]|nr:hypothetical protein [Planctomycetota bacterium]